MSNDMEAAMSTPPAIWDHALGRRLWDQGITTREIGRECGVAGSIVNYYARRNWPERAPQPRYKAWDYEVGRQMWVAGARPEAIAKAVGVSRVVVLSYAQRHWPPRPSKPPRERGPASWSEGMPTLPPLPSLTFGDD
jgi:hypothetical protein